MSALPEVIDLIDDSGGSYRNEIVLLGHHDPIVAMHAVVEYILGYEGGDLRDITLMNDGLSCRMSYAIPEPKYARWSCESGAFDDPSIRVLRQYDSPGRGRFKVMVSERIRKDGGTT